MGSEKRLLILGGPIFQVPVVRKAKEMGLHVGVIDINSDAPAFKYADEQFICSLRNNEDVYDKARQFAPDGIMCGACDTSVPVSAYLCSRIPSLVGHSLEVARRSTNKYEMIKAFEKAGVPHPQYRLITKDEIATAQPSKVYPVISKPTDSAGSRGINLIKSSDEFRDCVQKSSNAGISGDVIIEEYMQGPEVSVEVLTIDNEPHVLQITDKLTSGAPYFYEVGHSQPSELPNELKQKISDVAVNAVKAIGIKNSPVHVEIKCTEGGGRSLLNLVHD